MSPVQFHVDICYIVIQTCFKFRFWTHMFGSGIGELNVYVNQGSKDMKKIWSLSGDAGNNWYMGQAPISSIQPYKVSKSKMWMIKAPRGI